MEGKVKMRKAALGIAVLFLSVNLTGCAAPLIAGAAVGGVAVYAAGKDTVQGDSDKPYDSLWQASLTVARIRGTIKQEDSLQGRIELIAESTHVWINLIRLTPSTTRLKVSARKYRLPNMDMAQDLFVKIIAEVK